LPNFADKRGPRVRKLLRSAFAVVSPSEYLQEAFNSCRSDVQLIPNALDLSVYPARVRNRPAPRLIWLRAFREMYAPEVAVDAFAAIVSEFPDGRLVMIGPDRRDGSLQRTVDRAKHLGVADRVSIIPGVPRSEVPAYLDNADIFLNTTTIDNTPVSVIEALACGLCVVSTNVGGIPYLLRDGRDGLLVPPGDGVGMGAAVRRILTEEGLALKLSGNAVKKANKYSWNTVLPRWNRLLRSANPSGRADLNQDPCHASVD